MNTEEREVMFRLFMHGCPADLPDNIHISQDLLSRVTGFAIRKLRRILGAVQSLGFYATEHDEEAADHLGHGKQFVLEWHDTREDGFANATGIANAIMDLATMGCCEAHGLERLRRLDFSALSRALSTDPKP